MKDIHTYGYENVPSSSQTTLGGAYVQFVGADVVVDHAPQDLEGVVELDGSVEQLSRRLGRAVHALHVEVAQPDVQLLLLLPRRITDELLVCSLHFEFFNRMMTKRKVPLFCISFFSRCVVFCQIMENIGLITLKNCFASL